MILAPSNDNITMTLHTQTKNTHHFDVIIIGGGASGLMCAATAGQRGRRVLVLDASNKVGKKILMSGGGRCNFTNLHVDARKHFISANPHFCISALKRYKQSDFIALVEKYKIPYEERKHGQLFCLNSAKDILNMLLTECNAAAQVSDRLGSVTIQTHCTVDKVTSENEVFSLSTNQGVYTAASLVVASGALSIPSMGASGFGYDIARQFGHTVLPTRAGLVPFTFSDGFKDLSERLSGLAVDAALSSDAATFNEALLFTHRGLSGPAALQVSNYWDLGETITIDLLPEISSDDAQALLRTYKQSHPKSLLRTLLTDRFAKSLVAELQDAIWAQWAETPLAQWTDAALDNVAQTLKAWPQKPSGTEGYRTAEVTLGGVDTTQISSKTMESTLQKGLYFIGEVVDVSGHLGGFNFQWAWASGVAAGEVV
jgi:predicted Rossmann fold flavoprotein